VILYEGFDPTMQLYVFHHHHHILILYCQQLTTIGLRHHPFHNTFSLSCVTVVVAINTQSNRSSYMIQNHRHLFKKLRPWLKLFSRIIMIFNNVVETQW